MIRAAGGEYMSRKISKKLLNELSYSLDVDRISECENERCSISTDELEAIPEDIVYALISDVEAFEDVAGGQSSGDSSSWRFTDVPDGPSANGQSGKFYGWYEGGDMPHNNMMPYTVVKRWHRTA